jgi:hypothetical protein
VIPPFPSHPFIAVSILPPPSPGEKWYIRRLIDLRGSIAGPHPIRPAPPLQPALPLVSDESILSHHHPSSPQDRLAARNVQSPGLYGRDASGRGRPADAAALGLPTLQPQHGRRRQSHSKSPESGAARSGVGYEGGLERKPSTSYSHHRKTSIVHGIQHSRNPSYVNPSPSPNVLSPEIIAPSGLGGSNALGPESILAGRLEQPELPANYSSSGSLPQLSALSTIEDDASGEAANGHPKISAHKKMLSNGKPQRDQSHSRSHSKHPHQESKTVGEYALHHLFNSVMMVSLRLGCSS